MKQILSILRNPYGRGEMVMRRAKLTLCDEYEKLVKKVSELENDKKYLTLLDQAQQAEITSLKQTCKGLDRYVNKIKIDTAQKIKRRMNIHYAGQSAEFIEGANSAFNAIYLQIDQFIKELRDAKT